jgi:FixJ family two-component response regulator
MGVEQRGTRGDVPLHAAGRVEAGAIDRGAWLTRGVVHVVDDDASVRTALGRLLGAAGFEACCHASAAEFLVATRGDVPSCVVLDVSLPGLSGLDLFDALLRGGDPIPVIFLTGRGDIEMGVHAMKAGAVDFLTKPVQRDALLAALDTALLRAAAARTHRDELGRVRDRYARLTARQREVFAGVTLGRLNKQIAFDLGTSVRTIKAHRAEVMKRMEAASVADLVGMAATLARHPAT